jgi:hypothetical protein
VRVSLLKIRAVGYKPGRDMVVVFRGY